MANMAHQALLVLVALALINGNEAQAPLFLRAITSALGTIPFSAGPMTTGLMGAKLAVGSKLLYYLGFFGRSRSKPKRAPSKPARSKQRAGGPQIPGGMQAVPLPYAFGAGGFPPQFGGFGGGGGFGPGGFGGGGNPNVFTQFPQGYDPAQLMQMMAAQGIDPATAMQAMNNFGGGAGGQPQFPGGQPQFPGGGQPQFPGGGQPQFPGGGQPQFPGGGHAIPASQFPFPPGGAAGSAGGMQAPNEDLNDPPSDSDDFKDDGSENDVESFFTFLKDMDDNSCISRLMCDIGADPSFLGDFSENIHGIISSLNVIPTSGAYQYVAIMEKGKKDGNCAPKFPNCGDSAYEIVKNVAPSVGVPQNINVDAINRL